LNRMPRGRLRDSGEVIGTVFAPWHFLRVYARCR
jgi:hypothetical protein